MKSAYTSSKIFELLYSFYTETWWPSLIFYEKFFQKTFMIFCWHMFLWKPFCYHVVKPKLPKEIVIKLNLTKLINFVSKEKWLDFPYHTIWQEKTWFGKKNKLFPACIANSYWHQQKSARYLSNFWLFE